MQETTAGCAQAIASARAEESNAAFDLGMLYKKTTNADPNNKFQCFRDKKLLVEKDISNDLKELHTKFDEQVFPADPSTVKITLYDECEAVPSPYVAHDTRRGNDACLKE